MGGSPVERDWAASRERASLLLPLAYRIAASRPQDLIQARSCSTPAAASAPRSVSSKEPARTTSGERTLATRRLTCEGPTRQRSRRADGLLPVRGCELGPSSAPVSGLSSRAMGSEVLEVRLPAGSVCGGPGSIGQAIARRISAGKHVVLADLHKDNADGAAEVLAQRRVRCQHDDRRRVLSRLGCTRSSRPPPTHGDVTGLIHAAGVSPSQAPTEAIFAVDLYGTAVVLEEFGDVIARGGAGVVIASQSGHRLGGLTPEQNAALATVPADDLLKLPMVQPDQVTDTLHAYQLAKRGNALRVMAEAVRWAKRGARVNTLSPGIIITPLAVDELQRAARRGLSAYARTDPAGRAGTPTRSRP